MLEVNNLNVDIGRKKIIKNITFQVKTGAIVGLIGPNGAGKTTIMKTILGLTKFTGQISMDNHPITEGNHKILSEVGALIENPAIYPFLTGLQNLKLYSHDKNNMQQIVIQLGLEKYIEDLAKNYSLGMKQKLGIAIALLNQPKLVILDEPMNGLDIEATILVRKLIQQYARSGTSFLISSHILGELQKIMSEAIIINEGKLVINRAMSRFQRINHQHYQILSENQKIASDLLAKNNIQIKKSGNYLCIDAKDVFLAEDLLYKNNLRLLELLPKKIDFEQVVVSLLKNQERDIYEE
ncbi:ATP-binding cassette domain-containing protein [Bombilactobacillus bombi]|uniref:ABC transporter ATP-binding protein n=1 Tax=Bombilactobacillus bombi TaxID=1303590 RepID=UPI000E5804CA|nr:ATP-binding cassette domain-containing protein [Bombilactobacillus bombi]AXX64500.1 ATP-binding cassette domain-containing protein [Bombilactobacillus bombi]